MGEKKYNIDKNKLWSYNEALYTEEFCKQLREERHKATQELLAKLAKEKEERNNQEQVIGSALRKYEQEARARNDIISPFIKQHMEAKITIARWALGLGMAMTFLFKGQWLAWIVFIIMYFLYVNKIKADAIEADKRRKDFGKKK